MSSSEKISTEGEGEGEGGNEAPPAVSETASHEMTLAEKQQICRDFAQKTGYSLTVGANVRKYGGPPPDGSERPKNSEIFLGRLPATLFEDELVPILEKFGKLWEVRILLNEKLQFGRGFAFATFFTPKIAQNVVRSLTNKEISGFSGQNFSISLSKPHSLVVLRNLPKQKTRAVLMKDFEGFFEGILGINIWGVEGKPPLLVASLEFGSERAAAGALGQIIAGDVQPYNYKLDAYYSTCDHNDNAHIVVLHARNMPEDATEDKLRDFFSHYSAFERARIINKFAFIHFRDHLSAEKALQEQYGANFMGRPLELAWARTKTFVPQPPPPLPVSKESEERLYAYAHSSGRAHRNSAAPSSQRPHPYRDGPPRGDRRGRAGPPSHGSYRRHSPPRLGTVHPTAGRYESPPPQSFFNQPARADYRPPPPQQAYDGPLPHGNGFGGFQPNYPGDDRLASRPYVEEPDRYGYQPAPPPVMTQDRYSEPVRGPPADYDYTQQPTVTAPNYDFNRPQYPSPSAASYDYNPPLAPLPQTTYRQSQWQVTPPVPSTASYNYNEALSYGGGNGGSGSGSGSGGGGGGYNESSVNARVTVPNYGYSQSNVLPQQVRAPKYNQQPTAYGQQQQSARSRDDYAGGRSRPAGGGDTRFSSAYRGKTNGATRNGGGSGSGSGGRGGGGNSGGGGGGRGYSPTKPAYVAQQNGWEG